MTFPTAVVSSSGTCDRIGRMAVGWTTRAAAYDTASVAVPERHSTCLKEEDRAQRYRLIKSIFIPALCALLSILTAVVPAALPLSLSLSILCFGGMALVVASSWFLWRHLEHRYAQRTAEAWAQNYTLDTPPQASQAWRCELTRADAEKMMNGAEDHIVITLGDCDGQIWQFYMQKLTEQIKSKPTLKIFFMASSTLTSPRFQELLELKRLAPGRVHFEEAALLPEDPVWMMVDGVHWVDGVHGSAANPSETEPAKGHYYYEPNGTGPGRHRYQELLRGCITAHVMSMNREYDLPSARQYIAAIEQRFAPWRNIHPRQDTQPLAENLEFVSVAPT